MPNLHIRAQSIHGETLIQGLHEISRLSPTEMRKLLSNTKLAQSPRGNFSKEDISKILAKIGHKNPTAFGEKEIKQFEVFLGKAERRRERVERRKKEYLKDEAKKISDDLSQFSSVSKQDPIIPFQEPPDLPIG